MSSLENILVDFTETIQDGVDTPVAQNEQVEGVLPGNGQTLGSETAPVTIIEFSDFQCPYCSRSAPRLENLLEKYQGQIQIVYRHYPLPSHENAINAALAAECAGEQDNFWQMHDLLFDNQENLDLMSLNEYGQELGLDMGQFEVCMSSEQFITKINQDIADGQEYGVQGTPTFFINGYRIVGFHEPTVERIIEQELEKQG